MNETIPIQRSDALMPLMVEFTRGVAHELANPLNAIAMHAELAKGMVARGDAPRAVQLLEHILADCVRSARLVQGLRDFSSAMNVGKVERMLVRGIVEDALLIVSEEASEASALIETNIEYNGEIEVEKGALERALACLVQNACDAGATHVLLVVRADNEVVVFETHDDGSGIPEGLHDKIAKPFFSTRRSEGHAGLGLTLVDHLVGRQRGELSMGLALEGGTCMRIQLPRSVGAT